MFTLFSGTGVHRLRKSTVQPLYYCNVSFVLTFRHAEMVYSQDLFRGEQPSYPKQIFLQYIKYMNQNKILNVLFM